MTPRSTSAARARAAARRSGALHVAPALPERPPFDTFEAKLRPPPLRPGAVSRTSLVNRLRAESSLRIATVIAPAGYGKTTLLAQWADRDERPFVWLTVDQHDADPFVLLRHLAAGLDRLEPLEPLVTAGILAAGANVWSAAAPRLVSAFGSSPRPLVLVLDDAHLLRRGNPADIVLTLAESVPKGSMLVLAGRMAPSLPLARLRASGRLLELGPDDLALSRRESQLLLRGVGFDPDRDDMADLLARAEGWAAGLYLAARALDEEGPDAHPADVRGDDRFLSDYLRAEVLDTLRPERLAFLRRTSVLEEMSASLCDAVLGRRHAGRELDAIARSGSFLVPLDRHGGWCRYHTFLRDELRYELESIEPELVAVLHGRAADWFEQRGLLEPAVRHSAAAGDHDRAARLLVDLAAPAFHAGKLQTVERWLDDFARNAPLANYPALAALGAWVAALRGRADDTAQLLSAGERALARRNVPTATGTVRGALKLLRAASATAGPAQMARAAAAARSALPAGSSWLPRAAALEGVAAALRGGTLSADTLLQRAAAEAQRQSVPDVQLLSVAERSVLAAARGDHVPADELALEGRRLLDVGAAEDAMAAALAYAASARSSLRHGRWDEARHELEAAQRLDSLVSEALPWLALQVRLELGRAYVALRDGDAARRHVEEIAALLGRVPDGWAAAFARQAADLGRELDALVAEGDGHTTRLTSAELRLVPLLATHLSFREIGDRLFVSRNTIKTQAISVYRKLGVTSRSAAIERAVELGLVGDPTSAPEEFTPTR